MLLIASEERFVPSMGESSQPLDFYFRLGELISSYQSLSLTTDLSLNALDWTPDRDKVRQITFSAF